MKKYLLLLFIITTCLIPAQQNPLRSDTRIRTLINSGWLFLEDDIKDINDIYKSRKEWKIISLPHTWNRTDALDAVPGYRRAAGWYQNEVFISDAKRPYIYRLYFEGVNYKSEVYVNGRKAGYHTGGYTGFYVDITPFVKPGEKNKVVVKADNSYDPNLIPSQKSDFVLYGGITRNVWLEILPPGYIESVLIQTPEVSKSSAETAAKVVVYFSGKKGNSSLRLSIKDKENNVVSEASEKIKPEIGRYEYSIELPEIENPKLWSPSSPYLYTVEASLLTDTMIVDIFKDRVGYRWFEFEDHGAFYLNGERLLLRGTHRHEELSGYGSALTDDLHRRDMEMIKEMGANFVRLAHYPQAPEVYRACDELGLLVWDENPWCRGGVGPAEWQKNTENIFREMILQNYNHPSVIIWSIGNECDWLTDFKNGDNPDSLKAFAVRLNNIAKELDPYRLTAARKFSAAEDVVDVYSPSIWSGWYSDVYTNYDKALKAARDKYDKFLHAEYGGDSHAGRHFEHPFDGINKITSSGGDEPVNKALSSGIAGSGDWSESYIVNLFDYYLHVTENLEDFPGSAQWIFRDFATPLRPENPIPYVNQKGLVDMENTPKDAYYVFKSYWTIDPKFCYIESHTWDERRGTPGEKSLVKVFSNCTEVELFINGVSRGKKTRDVKKFPACGLNWEVNFTEGENNIIAQGYDTTLAASDKIEINYSTLPDGKPEFILLSQEPRPDGTFLVTAKVVDKNGRICTDFNERIYFSVLSGGRFIDLPGTPAGSSIIEMANGKAKIIFQPFSGREGVIEARTQQFQGSFIIVSQ
jgi:beta-galactosidase